ncbi:hypothetical protein ACFLTB_00550 [Chloroflexota bacterium]
MKRKAVNAVIWIIIIIGIIAVLVWNNMAGIENKPSTQENYDNTQGDGSRPWN